MSERYPSITFVTINLEVFTEAASELQVTMVPTLVFTSGKTVLSTVRPLKITWQKDEFLVTMKFDTYYDVAFYLPLKLIGSNEARISKTMKTFSEHQGFTPFEPEPYHL
jgi:hypothetical protein